MFCRPCKVKLWKGATVAPDMRECIVCFDFLDLEIGYHSCIFCLKDAKGQSVTRGCVVCKNCCQRIVQIDDRCPQCRRGGTPFGRWHSDLINLKAALSDLPDPEPIEDSFEPRIGMFSIKRCVWCVKIFRNLIVWTFIFFVTGLFCSMFFGAKFVEDFIKGNDRLTLATSLTCIFIGAIFWFLSTLCCCCQCGDRDRSECCDWKDLFCIFAR